MKCRIDLRRHAWIAGTALLAVLAIAPAAHAQLLGLDQGYPRISFDSAGRTTYDGTLLSVDASAIDFTPSALPDQLEFDLEGNVIGVRPITGERPTFTIRAHVNSAGVLIGGVAGHDLTITGSVDLTGMGLGPGLDGVVTGTAANPLLTGEVRTDVPSLGTDGTTNQLEFRFAITGGQLVLPFTGMDIGVRFTAPPLVVPGAGAGFASFAAPFVGGAAGAAFATECPAQGCMATAQLPPPTLPPPPPPPPPTLPPIFVEALDASGAPAIFDVTFVDFFGNPLAATCSPASGSTFPLGSTTVTCTSEPDMWGQQTGAALTVTVVDTTPPTISGANIIEVQATGSGGAEVLLAVTAVDRVDGEVPVTCSPASGSTFPIGTTTAVCGANDSRGNPSAPFPLSVTVTAPPPPVVMTSASNVVVEALGSSGAPATFSATAVDFFSQNLAVTCAPGSGSTFPLGTTTVPSTTVTCTSDPDPWGQTGQATLVVTVVDTTSPTISGDDIEVQATGADGAEVPLAVTAVDLVDGEVPVTCSPASGSTFPIGATTAVCEASDSRGNRSAPFSLLVTVKVEPPAIREGCFIVDFREITYFHDATVITSSDADIRMRAGITGPFDPTLWPYRASGGAGYTKSRGTLFRIYGFQPAEEGEAIPDADVSWISYVVTHDLATDGYYVDLGGPARVIVCPEQLHQFVLSGRKGNGHNRRSTLLPQSQRNVPGIMLSHNSQIVKLPTRVRAELYQLGMDPGARGVIDYIGFQLQGEGSATFREFVDIEFVFPGDSDTDRRQHFTDGFHTALNNNFESFAGCNYVDYAPGNDAVRLGDVWGPNRSKWWNYDASAACGTREPTVNSKQRANYDVPFNAIQLLPSVNSGSDTLRLLYGTIRDLTDAEKNGRDHRTDWEEWDRWDR